LSSLKFAGIVRGPSANVHYVTLPCRDLADAKRFLVDVLGGTVSSEAHSQVTVSMGGAEIVVAPHVGDWIVSPGRYATTSCPDEEQVDVAALNYASWTSPASIEAQ
jgi:catechol 2,3-dioxygenase-like lactoylglutathione lyase family enzyme